MIGGELEPKANVKDFEAWFKRVCAVKKGPKPKIKEIVWVSPNTFQVRGADDELLLMGGRSFYEALLSLAQKP